MSYPKDEFVVYRAPDPGDDGLFIAHSIRTDQLGMAETVGGAIYELLVALRKLYEEHEKDPAVRIDRMADESIQALYFNSDPLPEKYWHEAKSRLSNESDGEDQDGHGDGDLSAAVAHSRDVSEVTYYGLIVEAKQLV